MPENKVENPTLRNININIESINIKVSLPNDFENILKVEELAFGQKEESNLVADLLNDPTAKPLLSLVAFHNEKMIGHILFTKAVIKGLDILVHLLAPLAVLPEYQNLGIGKRLIQKGHEKLKEMGSKFVFVLGHPEYYPKSGYIPNAGSMGLQPPFSIEEKNSNAWMVIALDSLPLPKGQVLCADKLNKEEYWIE